MKRLLLAAAVLAASASVLFTSSAPAADEKSEQGWVSLFDGKTMSGWEMVPNNPNRPSKWEVVDGAMVGTGPPSMLYSPKGDYKNFRVRAEIKINDKGNSGFYFRAKKGGGFAGGYEAQVDSTHTDPIRTGSIYTMVHIFKQLVPPDTWFTYELEVKDLNYRGKPVTSIKVKVNDELLYELLDHDNLFKEGHFAFQQHDPGSKVQIRKVEVMEMK